MKLLRAIIAGRNTFGQVLYGVLDALPIPNLLNPARAALKQRPNSTASELLFATIAKTDPWRLVVGVVVSWAILTGRLTWEAIDTFLAVLSRL